MKKESFKKLRERKKELIKRCAYVLEKELTFFFSDYYTDMKFVAGG